MRWYKKRKDRREPFTLERAPKLMPSQAQARIQTRLENAVLSRPAGPDSRKSCSLGLPLSRKPRRALFFLPVGPLELPPRLPQSVARKVTHLCLGRFPVGSTRLHPKRLVQSKSPAPSLTFSWCPCCTPFFLCLSPWSGRAGGNGAVCTFE